MIETALILSAGFGSRLQPLSDIVPKPLFPVLNKPMLDWWLENLMAAGIKKVVINIHHLADKMLEHIDEAKKGIGSRLEIITSREETILGTGGGIKQARNFLGNDNFLLVNSDIFTDFDLAGLANSHQKTPGRLATLGLIDNSATANVSLGASDLVLAFRSSEPVTGEIARLSYAGVLALSPIIYDLIDDGFQDIIDVFNQAIKERYVISGWRYDPIMWDDIGTINNYWSLNKQLSAGRIIVHPSARCEDAKLEGWNVIGENCTINSDALVENSVVWPGSVIGPHAVLKNTVVCGTVPPGEIVDKAVFCNALG